MREFVIYLGAKDRTIIYDTRLSRKYELKRAVPAPVEGYDDKVVLLKYKENYGGCCGRGGEKRPIMSDVTYCKTRNLNLAEFREQWTKYYEENSKS
jgi:hypothetical protein